MTASSARRKKSTAPLKVHCCRDDVSPHARRGDFSHIAFAGFPMSLVSMTLAAEATPAQERSAASRRARWIRPALGLIVPAMLALAWEIVVRLGWSSGRLTPPPSVIFQTFVDLARTGELQRDTLVTLGRVAAGFALGAAVATVVGAATGYSALLRRLLDPSLQGLRAIPSIAWIPLFILWLGIFEASKVTLIAVGVFFPVYLGLMGAIQSVDRKLVEVGRAFRLSDFEMVRRILLPAVLPAYVLSLRSGLGLGWMFVVAAELMGASDGLGYLLIDGQQLGKPAEIVAAIVAFAIVGKATDWLIALAAAPFLRWQDVVRHD
jgi:sulfonate transport system permease protein